MLNPITDAVDDLPTYPITYTAGDRKPEITPTIEDEDITLWGIVMTIFRPKPSQPVSIPAIITDGPTGQHKFPWAATDLVAGLQQEVKITYTDDAGLPQTPVRFRLDVLP